MIQAQQLKENDRLLLQRADVITSQNQELQLQATENVSLIQQIQQQRRHTEETALREKQLQKDIASRKRQLRQLNHQLKQQEQVTAEIQQTNHSCRDIGTTATTAESAKYKATTATSFSRSG